MECEGKVKYSKHRAEVAVKLPQFKQKKRAYQCSQCFHWHLTTQRKNDKPEGFTKGN